MVSQSPYLQWLTSQTQSLYWHDSAVIDEQQIAFANGAVGVTTNPFLINASLRTNDPRFNLVDAESLNGLPATKRAEMLSQQIISYFTHAAMPLYSTGKPGVGYVCGQVNPRYHANEEKMFEDAVRLAEVAENLVVKLPATAAGLHVYEKILAMGYNAAMTVSFTVSQAIAAGLAAERGLATAEKNGIKPGLAIAVMMLGRLDDYLRDIALDTRAKVTEADIRLAGIACMKRAYQFFREKHLRAYLMPAGCRGEYHISSFSGARMIFSIGPAIYDALAQKNEPYYCQVDEPVNPLTINRLLTMSEFYKAYAFDGLKPEEFLSYGVVNRTLTQFIECGWAMLEKYPEY